MLKNAIEVKNGLLKMSLGFSQILAGSWTDLSIQCFYKARLYDISWTRTKYYYKLGVF